MQRNYVASGCPVTHRDGRFPQPKVGVAFYRHTATRTAESIKPAAQLQVSCIQLHPTHPAGCHAASDFRNTSSTSSMEVGLTFGSLGGIIAICQLSVQLSRALGLGCRATGGSAKDYQDLLQDLALFVQILLQVGSNHFPSLLTAPVRRLASFIGK